MKIKKNNIYIILFKLLLVLIYFDGIRSNLLYNEYFSQIKEVLLLFLFLNTISRGYVFNKKNNLINIGGTLFFLYHFISGLFSITESFTIFYKTFELLMAALVFYNLENFTKRPYSYFLTYAVNISVIFTILDIVLFFIPLPIWNRSTFWWGRFAVGYPTMDTITLAYTLIILLFYNDLSIKKIWRFVFTIIITIGIIMQVTGSGIILLVLIYGATLLYISRKKNTGLGKNIIWIYIGICACLIVGPPIIANISPETYDNAEALLETKIANLSGNKNDESVGNTIEIRESSIKEAKRLQNTDIKKIFGIGISKFTMDDKLKSKGYISLENQYAHIQIAYGYIGLILFLLFIAINVYKIMFKVNLSFNMRLIFLLSAIIFVINSEVLLSLILFPNCVFYAFFLAYFARLNNINKISRNNSLLYNG